MYLLDTNILSELRRGSRQAATWMDPVSSADLFVSVVTLGELSKGVALLTRKDPRSAAVLAGWLDVVRRRYRGGLLPVSDDVALEWGRLEAQRPRGPDGLIAATAMVHRLSLVTRNVADFRDVPVQLINPWNEADR